MRNDRRGCYQFSPVLCQSFTIIPGARDFEDKGHAMKETTEKHINWKTGFSFGGFLSQWNLSLILGRASSPMKISTVIFRKYGRVVHYYKN